MSDTQLFLTLGGLAVLVVAVFAAFLAAWKRRSRVRWFFLVIVGALFGFIALIVLPILPSPAPLATEARLLAAEGQLLLSRHDSTVAELESTIVELEAVTDALVRNRKQREDNERIRAVGIPTVIFIGGLVPLLLLAFLPFRPPRAPVPLAQPPPPPREV